jgi:hypothetical protein
MGHILCEVACRTALDTATEKQLKRIAKSLKVEE